MPRAYGAPKSRSLAALGRCLAPTAHPKADPSRLRRAQKQIPRACGARDDRLRPAYEKERRIKGTPSDVSLDSEAAGTFPTMNRRDFLQRAGAASASLVFAPRVAGAPGALPDDWRRFEVMTRVEVVKPIGATRVWVPGALVQETPYQQTIANTFNAPGGKARFVERKDDALGIVVAEFPAGVAPVVTVTSRIGTRNVGVDLGPHPLTPSPKGEGEQNLKHFLRPTRLLPTDGIVKEKADEITRGAKSDVDKARAIYDW
ncbi:MAG: hypothetical protein DMD54_16460, partial [Gemmatimonadetes bacterium]